VHKKKLHALQEAAWKYRENAARAADADARWECERGHAWDDQVSASQNVRCMNCASQRREMHTARLHALADARGGLLLLASYIDAGTPLRWQCAFGHGRESRADVVGRQWCSQCSGSGAYDDKPLHRADEQTPEPQTERAADRG
jgi:hypothetical protein